MASSARKVSKEIRITRTFSGDLRMILDTIRIMTWTPLIPDTRLRDYELRSCRRKTRSGKGLDFFCYHTITRILKIFFTTRTKFPNRYPAK